MTRTPLALLAALLAVPAALAGPPEGSECLFGYEPSALVNFCQGDPAPEAVVVPGVPKAEVEPQQGPQVCPHAMPCVRLPWVETTPSQGTPVSVPNPLGITYLSVSRVVVYSSDGEDWRATTLHVICNATGEPYDWTPWNDQVDFARWLVACARASEGGGA